MNNPCNYKYVAYPYIAIFFIFVLLITYFRYFKRTLVTNIAVAFVILGGVFNLIEWHFNKCVVDYIRFFDISFYNISDLLIILGLGVLLIHTIYGNK